MDQVIAGIDLAAGRGTTEIAVLELPVGQTQPRYRSLLHQRTVTDEDIIAVLAEAHPTVIAIDSPLSLPAAVVAALRDAAVSPGSPTLSSSIGAVCTLPSETLATSPYTRLAERDPLWSGLGIRPLPVSFLGGLTFRALVLVPNLRHIVPEAAIIEVFPTATLRMLGVGRSRGGTKREAKTSEVARRTTQRGLAHVIAGIPSTDDELLGADLLDALAAALTGVAYFRGEYVAAGDPAEGQIVLPSKAFLDHLMAVASPLAKEE